MTTHLHSDSELSLLLKQIRTFGKWSKREKKKKKKMSKGKNTAHSSGTVAILLLLNLLISAERQRDERKGRMGKDRAKQLENRGQERREADGMWT